MPEIDCLVPLTVAGDLLCSRVPVSANIVRYEQPSQQ